MPIERCDECRRNLSCPKHPPMIRPQMTEGDRLARAYTRTVYKGGSRPYDTLRNHTKADFLAGFEAGRKSRDAEVEMLQDLLRKFHAAAQPEALTQGGAE